MSSQRGGARTASFRSTALFSSHSSWTTCVFPPEAEGRLKHSMRDTFAGKELIGGTFKEKLFSELNKQAYAHRRGEELFSQRRP